MTLTATMQRPIRALFVGTHPVQYSAPIFRRLAEHPQLEIQVAYCSMQGAEPRLDPGFGIDVKWDVPLLEGYDVGFVAESLTGSEGGFVFRSSQPGNLEPDFRRQVRRGRLIHGLCVCIVLDCARRRQMEPHSRLFWDRCARTCAT